MEEEEEEEKEEEEMAELTGGLLLREMKKHENKCRWRWRVCLWAGTLREGACPEEHYSALLQRKLA